MAAADPAVLILAIDTTTRAGSVAVMRDHTLLAVVPGDETRTHGERVPGEMARALAEAGVTRSAVDLVAVASGPGAFTGLRIGIATAQGVALALDRPVAGVSALDALAWTADAVGRGEFALVAPWMDAQRGEVFAALYSVLGAPETPATGEPSWRPWAVVESAVAADPSALLDRWPLHLAGARVLFIGDAVSRDAEVIDRLGAGLWQRRVPGPLGPAIAHIGRCLALAGQAGPPHGLVPIYARRPDAEILRAREGDT